MQNYHGLYRCFVLIFVLLLTVATHAQRHKAPKARITENTVVKDTAGNLVPAVVWQQLARSSHYAFTPVDPAQEDSDFIIRLLTEEEKIAQLDKMPRPRESNSFRTGRQISHFATKDLEGKLHSLKALQGKVVVLNFWFINCPPCRTEIPELNALVDKYKANEEVVFLAIALDDPYQLHQFLKRMPFNYNIIADGIDIAKNYRVKSFPTHVVVDREGKVLFHTAGLAPNTVHWVKKSIESALAKPAVQSDVAQQ